MITENLSTLKIHKLTQEQYDRELTNNTLDENALYLTPEEEIDLTPYATIEQLNEKADISHTHNEDYDVKGAAAEVEQNVKGYVDGLINTKANINLSNVTSDAITNIGALPSNSPYFERTVWLVPFTYPEYTTFSIPNNDSSIYYTKYFDLPIPINFEVYSYEMKVDIFGLKAYGDVSDTKILADIMLRTNEGNEPIILNCKCTTLSDGEHLNFPSYLTNQLNISSAGRICRVYEGYESGHRVEGMLIRSGSINTARIHTKLGLRIDVGSGDGHPVETMGIKFTYRALEQKE